MPPKAEANGGISVREQNRSYRPYTSGMGNMPPVVRLTDWFTRVRHAVAAAYGPEPDAAVDGCAYCRTRSRKPGNAYCSDACESDAEGFAALP